MKPLSAAEFLEAYGAEEHNESVPSSTAPSRSPSLPHMCMLTLLLSSSEPEILIDEDETENIKNEDVKNEDIKNEDVKDENVKDENIKAEGMITHTIKRIKINFKRVKTEDDNIEDGTVKVVRTKRVRFEEDKPEGVESKGGNEETSASKAL
jgi:hypothetical protein